MAELRRCESPGGRRELGAFSIEGTRLVERALRAGARLRAVLVDSAYAERGPREARLIAELRAAELELHVLEGGELDELLGGRTYGEILALVERAGEPTLADCLAGGPGRAALLVAVDLRDPGNLGALARTALASGARALVAVGESDPFHPKALRTSMGSLLRLPVLERASARELVDELREAGVTSWGACARGGDPPRSLAAERSAAALFLGSEAFGLDPELVELLDGRVSIPMAPGVDSLSVNAAAAVCLYELLGRYRTRRE